MRALRYDHYGDPSVVGLAEAEPPRPAAGELLVRVVRAGLNPLDVKIVAGHLRLLPGMARPPRGVGVDFAGTVEGIGGGTMLGAFPGTRVFGTLSPFKRQGSCAEFCVIPAAAAAVVPEGVDFATAAALPVSAGTAVQALVDHARLAAGQRVVVLGAAGGVGHYAVQLARHLGAEVTGICGPSNLEFVASLGAARVVDYTREPEPVADRPWDVVLDAAGVSSLGRWRERLAPDGVYLNTSPDLRAIATTVADAIRARLTGGPRGVALVFKPGRVALERLADCARRGILVPQVRATVGLDGVRGALAELARGHGRGKVLVDPAA